MKEYYLRVEEIKDATSYLNVGDIVYLTGYIYTARDAVHKKLVELLKEGKELPINLKGIVVYYAGPTPAKRLAVGSCGPTTSSRMDKFTYPLLKNGVIALIGKGPRDEEILKAIALSGAIYFCAIGGAGALASKYIKECEVVAFKELGCEAIHRLKIDEFPLIVGYDKFGNNIFVKEDKNG